MKYNRDFDPEVQPEDGMARLGFRFGVLASQRYGSPRRTTSLMCSTHVNKAAQGGWEEEVSITSPHQWCLKAPNVEAIESKHHVLYWGLGD